jgi:hypothetical protein
LGTALLLPGENVGLTADEALRFAEDELEGLIFDAE